MIDPLVRVEMRFKNAALWNAVQSAAVPDKDYKRSFSRGRLAAFCRVHGLCYQRVLALLTLKSSPWLCSTGGRLQWRPIAERIASCLDMSPEALFSRELYARRWPTFMTVDAPLSRVMSLGAVPPSRLALPPTQDDELSLDELRRAVHRVLNSLPPTEAEVIRKRFGIADGVEYTLSELENSIGVTHERIRQIEAEALSKLRHPSRSRPLRSFLDGAA